MNPTSSLPTFRSLMLAMAAVAAAVGASAIWTLYRAGYQETMADVENHAVVLANVIEAVARFDKRYSANANPAGSWGATMSQVEEGVLMQGPAESHGEITFGRREGEQIVVLHAIHGAGLKEVARLPFGGDRAQPLSRALSGQRGAAELVDYAGRPVLAGYAPIPSLDIGIVYKVDLADVRAPFVTAALWASGIGAGFIALGIWGFITLIRPLQRHMDESERHAVEVLRESESQLNAAQHQAQLGS